MKDKELVIVTRGVTREGPDTWVKRAYYHWNQLYECCNDAKSLHTKGGVDVRVFELGSDGSHRRCLGIYNDIDDSTLDRSNSACIQMLVKKFMADIGCLRSSTFRLKHMLIYDNYGNVGVNIEDRFSNVGMHIRDVRYVNYGELLAVGINMSPKQFMLRIQKFINDILDYTCRLDSISIKIEPHDFPNIFYAFTPKEIPILEVNII